MQRKRTTLTGLVLAIIGYSVGGCTVGKDGHTYVDGNCVTCLNNPLTGQAMNYEKTSPDYVAGKNYAAEQRRIRLAQGGRAVANVPKEKGVITFSVKKPIDITYLRVKKEFGFFTMEERVRATHIPGGSRPWVEQTGEFRYEALPGVSYHMREYTGHVYKGVNGEQTIDARLETNGAGTDITFTYWVPLPKVELAAFGNSLKQRALRALR